MICGACVCVSQVTPNYTNELFLLIDYRNLLFMNLVFFIFSNRSSIMYMLLSTKYVHLMSIYIMSTKVNVIRYNTSIETPTSHQIFMPNLKKKMWYWTEDIAFYKYCIIHNMQQITKKQFKYSLQRSPGTQQTSVTSAH